MRVVLAAAAGMVALALAGCGGHPSAVAPRERDTASADSDGGRSPASSERGDRQEQGQGRDREDPRDAPVPQVDGKPMWAANRQHSAEENARAQFSRNGADFGARDEDDYVSRAHAFISHPPEGAQILERTNGDRLIYDPKANTFAVVSRSGAPRTLFKPRDGAAYWAQQKSRAADGDRGGRGSEGG